MSKTNSHQLIIRTCTSLASATLCATIFLTTGANKVSASSMPLPIQSNVEKNIDNANQVLISNKLSNKGIESRDDTRDNWSNVNYKYDDNTNTLTIYGGTLTNPLTIENKFGDTIAHSITKINILGKLTLIGDASGFFNDLRSLTDIDGMTNINTSQVTDMAAMFFGDTQLQSIDVSSFDTRNVTTMSLMFNSLSKVTSINCENFATDNVTNMGNMFSGCTSLKQLDLNSWNTANVTNMTGVFESCSSLTFLEVSKWKTGKVINASWLFDRCKNLKNLDVSNWDTSNIIDMNTIFQSCQSLV